MRPPHKLINDLSSITLDDRYTVAIPTTVETSYDNVPILRSAVVMQGLLKTPGWALSCFYRIIQEFHEVVPPSWAAGAARAGDSTVASAFVTGGYGQTLRALERALPETAWPHKSS